VWVQQEEVQRRKVRPPRVEFRFGFDEASVVKCTGELGLVLCQSKCCAVK
jgi:hypothetical protein